MPKVLGEAEAANLGGLKLEKKDKFWIQHETFERSYYVLADNTGQREQEIVRTTGVPALLEIIQGCVCVDKKAKEVATVVHPTSHAQTILWEVTAKFDNTLDPDDVESDQSPEARRPKIRWYGENEEEVLERDAVTGAAIVTVPGEKILLPAPVTLPILEIQRIEVFPFEPSINLTYPNRVNSTSFWGAPQGTALMLPVEAEEIEIEGELYVDVKYKIKFRLKEDPDNPGTLMTDSWKARPLHQGHLYFGSFPDIGPHVARDDNGQPIVVNLDAEGLRLDPEAEPVFLEFNRVAYADFNNLNLGPFN